MTFRARAAVLHAVPGSLDICDLEMGEPAPHEVVIKTAAAGICHSDLHALDGTFPVRPPVVLGHESSGVVEAVGGAVSELAVGHRVVTCLSAFCGHCEHCLTGRPYLCVSPDTHPWARPFTTADGQKVGRLVGLGSFAERMVVHERAAVRIADDVPLDVAALLGCAVTTGVGAVVNTARVPVGATVAVIGCGGVGLSCIQGARLAGAASIVAIDRQPAKLQLARRLGATDVVDASSSDDVTTAVVKLTGGVEFSFEAIGRRDTAAQAVAMLRSGGTATLIGVLPPGQEIGIPADELIVRGKRVQGSVMGSNRFRLDLPRYAQLYLQGRLDLEPLVSARIPLEGVNDAMQRLRTGDGARSLILFGE